MLKLYDEFAGWGGSAQGAEAVPGVEVFLAANHKRIAVEVHALNFPRADHYLGDVAKADITKFPRADLFWSSPVCPPWSNARGKRRDFDRSSQTVLFHGARTADEAQVQRSRALMEEVPRYLKAMRLRGKPVLAGVVENVVECRNWDQWNRWLGEIKGEGYRVRVIALNAMHAQPVGTLRAPQSRDRLFVAYWLDTPGLDPDWDKWLRPPAFCDRCDQTVTALQVFKNPRNDMGRYGRHGQYYYRCPNRTCRHQIVHPAVLPAADAIDWSLDPGQRIGDRVDAKGRPDPLEPPTLTRIRVGIRRHARPFLVPATGAPGTGDGPGVSSVPPFITSLRGGGSKTATAGVDQPFATFSAQGTHHGLVIPPGQLLVPYYSTGVARPVSSPLGTLSTRDRFALVGVPDAVVDEDQLPAVEDCTFRMIAAKEIQRGMAFADDYQVLGTKTEQVEGFGNAVPPPFSEVILSALAEAIYGEPLPHWSDRAAVAA